VIITLVILRFQLPHATLAVFYGVHRSTITRAVGEVRPPRGNHTPASRQASTSRPQSCAYS
jgi:hypothetical protein